MDEKVAKHICASAIRCSSILGNIIPFSRDNCSDGDYKKVVLAVANVAAAILEQIVDPIYEEWPNVKKEIEASIEKYGVVV